MIIIRRRRLDDPIEMLRHINRKVDLIMTDLTNLHTAVASLQTEVGVAVEALNDLAAKIAAGTASQADVDQITQQLSDASQALADAVAADDPGVGGDVTPSE